MINKNKIDKILFFFLVLLVTFRPWPVYQMTSLFFVVMGLTHVVVYHIITKADASMTLSCMKMRSLKWIILYSSMVIYVWKFLFGLHCKMATTGQILFKCGTYVVAHGKFSEYGVMTF